MPSIGSFARGTLLGAISAGLITCQAGNANHKAGGIVELFMIFGLGICLLLICAGMVLY